MNNDHHNLPHEGLLLGGLDGTNPLGFMAALGAFRLLSIENSNVTMTWQVFNGAWRPTLFGIQVPIAQLGNELHAAISRLDKSVWSIDKKLPFAAVRLRQEACNAAHAASSTSRGLADAIAGLGVECCVDDKGLFKDTALRLVRAADNNKDKNEQKGLLAFAMETIAITTACQIQKSISSDWLYEDKKLTFRWDPVENRGYALQWQDPSDDGALTERGANCLALFALPYFPTIPTKGQAETTGFGLKKPRQSSFTWPIWQHRISLDIAASMLGISELQREQPPRLELEARGIAAVYRCDRVMTSTYYANFTPARRVA